MIFKKGDIKVKQDALYFERVSFIVKIIQSGKNLLFSPGHTCLLDIKANHTRSSKYA